jgi:hypothetical protein
MIMLSASAMIVEVISSGRIRPAGGAEMSEAEVLQHQIAEARIAARAAPAHRHGLVPWLVRHSPFSHRPAPGADKGQATNWSEPALQTPATSAH